MEEKEFASSDSDDSDFEVNLEEELSEDSEQSDYEGSENESDDAQEESNGKKTKKSKTRRKKSKKSAKKQTRLSNVNEESELNSTQSSDNESNKLTAEQEKERADSLWKSFLNETNTPSKAQSSHTKSTTSSKTETASQDSSKVVNTKQTSTTKTEKVADTKTLDTKETVKLTLKSPLASTNENGNKCKVSPLSVQDSSKKRGLSNFLGNIQKKSKLSTLEKSKLDWNQFKEENNLQEEITTFNRGKDGYLEKQDFLQRTDSRQFELEKEMRHVGRRKAR